MFDCHIHQSIHHVRFESPMVSDALSKNVAIPQLKISHIVLTLEILGCKLRSCSCEKSVLFSRLNDVRYQAVILHLALKALQVEEKES